MDAYLLNYSRAKFHPDPIWIDGHLSRLLSCDKTKIRLF